MEGRLKCFKQSTPTKRITTLFTIILLLLAISVKAGTLKQNETNAELPIPNPTTLIALTTSLASHNAATVTSTSTITSAAAPSVTYSADITATNEGKYVSVSSVSKSERRQNVVYFATSYAGIGLKYRWGAASLDDGFDCSGFVRYVLDYFDFKTKRTSVQQFEEGTPIPVSQARAGDLVFFGSKKAVSHVAMVVSNDEKGLIVVHSTCTQGVHEENITESSYWKPKLKEQAVNIIGD